MPAPLALPVIFLLLSLMPAGGSPRAELEGAVIEGSPDDAFRGIVVDPQGRPVPFARLAVASAEHGILGYGGLRPFAYEERGTETGSGLYAAEGITDMDGRFVVHDLSEGTYNLVVAHARLGCAVRSGVPVGQASVPLTIELAPPTFLEGAIQGLPDAGRMEFGNVDVRATYAGTGPGQARTGKPDEKRLAVQPVNLLLLPPEAQPDAPFHVFDLGPFPVGGSWILTVQYDDQERSTPCILRRMSITLAEGEHNRTSIDLEDGHRLEGRFTGPDGGPLEEVAIELKPLDRLKARERGDDVIVPVHGTLTDAHGRFLVRVGAPGRYRLQARRRAVRPKEPCGWGPLQFSITREVLVPAEAGAPPLSIELGRFIAPQVGEKAPDFTATTQTGERVRLSDLEGKFVYLVFWSSWCPIRHDYLQELQRAYERHQHSDNVLFLGMVLARDPHEASALLEEHGITWPHVLLATPHENPILDRYGLSGLPAHFVIDRDGRIIGRGTGGGEPAK